MLEVEPTGQCGRIAMVPPEAQRASSGRGILAEGQVAPINKEFGGAP